MPITWGPDAHWPPPGGEHCARLFEEYRRWYVGDPVELARWYSPNAGYGLNVRPSQRASGLYGWFGRMFWGQPAIGTVGDMERMHIPAAANVSALSADLLYSEPPTVTIEDEGATERMQAILTEGGVYAVMAQAAELASAYGSSYIRCTVDKEVADHPIAEALTPHCAIPEWRSGHLVAITFWRGLPGDGKGGVLRHLERHEAGSVEHQLRRGSDDRLGQRVSLREAPETERLATLGGDDGPIATGIDVLDVIHHPNVLPNRLLPDEPIGRSDYDGAIGAMQTLDETWSLWMDAIRLARPRIIVPQEYTRGLGPGRGATFDAAQRIFTAVKALDPQQPLQIEKIDFAVNVDQYERTAAGNWRTIVRNAGLSADAFGEEASGAQATATEIGQRGARTVSTRARKVDYASRSFRRTALVLAKLDARYYSTEGSKPDLPMAVQYPDGVTPDPKKDAEIIGLLDAAGAISLRTKISMAHPDWDDIEIDKEATRIEDEKASSAPADPGTFDTPAPDPTAALGANGNQPAPAVMVPFSG